QGDKLPSPFYPRDGDNSDPRINFWHRLGTVFLASTLVTGLVMGVRSRGILEASELSSYDQMLQMRPQEGPDPRLLIVAIKPEDLKLPEQKQRGLRSLSDLALDKLLQKLESYQPRTIGLDIFRPFAVNSKQPGLANRLQDNHNLFAICHVPEPKSNSSQYKPPPEVPEKRQGFSNVAEDPGKIVRRHLLSMTIPATSSCASKDDNYALNVKLASHYLGVKVKHTDKWNLQIGKVLFRRLKLNPGAYYKGDTWGTQVMLNYRSYRSPLEIAEIVTLKQVLRDEVKPEKVKDKIVIIGAIHETSDYFYTPYSDAHSPSQKIPGVILQAQMVSQILSAVDGTRPLIMPLPVWQEVLWVWVWLLIAGILIWHFRKLIALCLVGCITIGLLYGICYYFLTQGYWVPFIPAFIGIIAVAICLNIYITYSTQEIS
ncbi:MAG: CHASE2 domain-containing protein, partial [Cyanobacteria bacterium J06628_3]